MVRDLLKRRRWCRHNESKVTAENCTDNRRRNYYPLKTLPLCIDEALYRSRVTDSVETVDRNTSMVSEGGERV